MDLLGSARLGYGKVLWWRGCSGTTVFPQTQRVRLVRLSLFGCDPTTSISSAGNPRTSHGNTVCESAQTDDCTGNHPRSTPSRCFAQRSSRARGLIRGWIQTALKNCVSPKKSHQRSQSTGCVLVRKAPTNSQASAPQVKGRWGLQRLPRQGVNVKST